MLKKVICKFGIIWESVLKFYFDNVLQKSIIILAVFILRHSALFIGVRDFRCNFFCIWLFGITELSGSGSEFDFRPYLNDLYHSTLKRLKAADIDQEVKERAISTMWVFYTVLFFEIIPRLESNYNFVFSVDMVYFSENCLMSLSGDFLFPRKILI